MNLEKMIAGHILRATVDSVPKAALDRAKVSILDVLAVMIGGSEDPITRKAFDFAAQMGGVAESHVLGVAQKLPAANAAFVNATMARVLDFDETLEITINGCHASAYDIPPILALAERDPTVSGAEFLAAVAVAMDVHLRLSRAITASPVDTGRDNGVSAFGATVAAAKILRLSEDETLSALGIAYAQAAGEFQMYEETSHTISLQQGMRARTGVDCALMAKVGLNGPHEMFTGKYGFYRAFEPQFDPDRILNNLGEEFAGEQISFKHYPCCRATHTGVAAMLGLRAREGFQPEDIEAIRIGTTEKNIAIVVEPVAEKWNPLNSVTAKFSLPYTVAVAAVNGEVGLKDFRPEALRSQAVRAMMPRISAHRDPKIEARHPIAQNVPAEVTVQLKNGRSVSMLVERPPGHPENPARFSDAENKLKQCNEIAGNPYAPQQLSALAQSIETLETSHMGEFFVNLFALQRSGADR